MLDNAADTLTLDTAMIDMWQADENFDYAREMVQSGFSLREWIYRHIGEFLYNIFNSTFYSDNRTFIWCSVGAVFLIAVFFFLYRKKLILFGRNDSIPQEYEVTEDTIYGIDFPEKISLAMEQGDYREAVRLTYLHALKELSDNGRIDWQPYKTPAQYVAEVKTRDFRTFSNHFLRVRYGNFTATEELVAEMQRLRLIVTGSCGNTLKGGGR